MISDLNQVCPYVIQNAERTLIDRSLTYNMNVLGYQGNDAKVHSKGKFPNQHVHATNTRSTQPKEKLVLVRFKPYTTPSLELIGKIKNGKALLLKDNQIKSSVCTKVSLPSSINNNTAKQTVGANNRQRNSDNDYVCLAPEIVTVPHPHSVIPEQLAVKVKQEQEASGVQVDATPKSRTVGVNTDDTLLIPLIKKHASKLERKTSTVNAQTQVDAAMWNNTDLDDIFESLSEDKLNRQVELQRDRQQAIKKQFFQDLKTCCDVDNTGNFPLHGAVLSNDVKHVTRYATAMKILKISIDILNDDNQTALQLAVISNASIDILQVLIETFRANTEVYDTHGNNLLHLAVLYSDPATLAILTSLIDIRVYSEETNFDGITPLIMSVLENDPDKVETLLKAGVNPNIGDKKSGRTPLFHAVESDNYVMVKLLLEYYAQTKIKNFFGTSPHDAMFDMDNIDPKIKKLILNHKTPKLKFKKRKFKDVEHDDPDYKEVKRLRLSPSFESM